MLIPTLRHSFKAHLLLSCAAALLAGCASKSGLREPLQDAPPVHSASFRQTIGHVLGTPMSGGNRVTTLLNGDAIFPAMLGGIRSARRTITFETFVFEKGDMPQAFAEALAERARAGVKVHMIVDAYGGRKSRAYDRQLEDAGVELERYNHVWYPDLRRYNHRTHRKLLVIDGKVGFIGGVGIADEWAGQGESPEHWRDTHYRVEGPAVAELQGAFADNWLRTHGVLLVGPDYFPAIARAGQVQASLFYSSPRHGRYAVPLMYQLAIASARQTLKIENAYFIPDQPLTEAFIAAEKRGVQVQIIVPGRHIDQKAVRRASRKRWARLLAAGVEIYEFAPSMIHCKLLIADGLFASVGSANFDNRSLRLNDEANLNVLDAGFAAEQTGMFQRDLAQSNQATRENLKSKTLVEKPLQAAQRPIENQL